MATKSILSSFNLSKSQKQRIVDKPTQRRNKLIAKLNEQILVVQAHLRGEEYLSSKNVTKVDEEGNKVTSTVPKRVAKWFYTNDGKEWFLEVKYGSRALQLAKDKNAILVGALDNMVDVIEKVKEAVIANELDAAIAAIATRKAA